MRHLIVVALLLATAILAAALPPQAIQQALHAIIPHATVGPCPALRPTPNYYADGSEQTALEAINRARANEGLPSLALPASYWQLPPSQQQFILVNLERTSRGLKPLQWDANLAEIATAYSQQMVQLHFFSHTSPISGNFQTRLNANPYVSGHYQTIAENLAGNWAPAAGAVYEYLYNDVAQGCTHRQNLLNPAFRFIGIGVVPGGPWHAISAQEFLAPDPDNPYVSAPPDTTPPTVTITGTLNNTQTALQVSAHASDNQGIAQIIWYLDGIGHLSHQGEQWTLQRTRLPLGHHTLIAYAVDGSQHYAAATYSLTINTQGILLGK